MKKILFVSCLFLSACGSDEVVVEKRADISYAAVEPAAGMTYSEFREHETWGQGDMHEAQKRFIILDRNNDGRLSDEELGGN